MQTIGLEFICMLVTVVVTGFVTELICSGINRSLRRYRIKQRRKPFPHR